MLTAITDHNTQLLVDAEQYYPAMLDAISRAKQLILLEMYLWEPGLAGQQFLTALIAARARGVNVFLLVDDFGSSSMRNQLSAAARHHGIALAFFNPLSPWKWRRNLFRTHRKLLIVDQCTTFLGGAGFSDEFIAPSSNWHDVMLKITGPSSTFWQASFMEQWSRWGNNTHRPPFRSCEEGAVLSQPLAMTPHNRGQTLKTLLRLILEARERIWITSPYFLPSIKLRHALKRAARRGVDVRLLLPGSRTDHALVRFASQRFYGFFLRNAIRIYEYQPRFIHAKIMLIDETCMVGSYNLDRWSLRWNLEASQLVRNPDLAGQIDRLMRHDFSASTEITDQEWQNRPWQSRLATYFSSRLEDWLSMSAWRSQIRLEATRRQPDEYSHGEKNE